MHRFLAGIFVVIAALALQVAVPPVKAQEQTRPDSFLLTIFLRHDQSQTLDEIQDRLRRSRGT